MSNAPQPDPEEQSFAASVQKGVRQLREERGSCPGSEELVALFEGRLAKEDALRVQAHVEACGLCDLVLGRLGMADRRLASEHTAGGSWILARLWNPIVAYGLAALLIYPAYLGVRQLLSPKEPPQLTASAISIPSFSLDSERSTEPAGQPHVVRLADQEPSFLLEFFVPMRTDRRYFVEIRDGMGRTTVSRREVVSRSSLGRIALVCRRDAFAAGDYTLTITEDGSASRRFAYVFQIE